MEEDGDGDATMCCKKKPPQSEIARLSPACMRPNEEYHHGGLYCISINTFILQIVFHFILALTCLRHRVRVRVCALARIPICSFHTRVYVLCVPRLIDRERERELCVYFVLKTGGIGIRKGWGGMLSINRKSETQVESLNYNHKHNSLN